MDEFEKAIFALSVLWTVYLYILYVWAKERFDK